MAQRYGLKNGTIAEDPEGAFVTVGDHEKLRLLLAGVILRLASFNGDFMQRLVDTLEEDNG